SAASISRVTTISPIPPQPARNEKAMGYFSTHAWSSMNAAAMQYGSGCAGRDGATSEVQEADGVTSEVQEVGASDEAPTAGGRVRRRRAGWSRATPLRTCGWEDQTPAAS